VRPENSIRGLRGEQRVSAAVISGNRLTDSEAKAKRSEAVSASPLGLYLFPGRCAKSGADKRRKCL